MRHANAKLAAAERAKAEAHRLLADAHDAAAAALLEKEELPVPAAPSSGDLLTRKTWPAHCPTTWTVLLAAAKKKGELTIYKCGRTPALKRADVDAWLERNVVRKPAAGDDWAAVVNSTGRG